MHSESWWIRLMDDDLTSGEREQWNQHLWGCEWCQREWAALSAADEVLEMAAVAMPPLAIMPLSAAFTEATVARVVRKQRFQRLVTYVAGAFIIGLVAWVVVTLLGATYSALLSYISAVLSARHIVFQSLLQTSVGLLLSWKVALPYLVGGTLALYLVLMPHGVLVTAALFWLSRRRLSAAVAVGV
jgi:anti-sigma factor RsiW